MNHKEFYIWLDGYLAGRLDSNIVDIDLIVKKMKEVKSDSDIDWSSLRRNKQTSPFNPITIPLGDNDDLGHPPKIVM